MMVSKCYQLLADDNTMTRSPFLLNPSHLSALKETSSGRKGRGDMSRVDCEETTPRVSASELCRGGQVMIRGRFGVGWSQPRSFSRLNQLMSLHHAFPLLLPLPLSTAASQNSS